MGRSVPGVTSATEGKKFCRTCTALRRVFVQTVRKRCKLSRRCIWGGTQYCTSSQEKERYRQEAFETTSISSPVYINRVIFKQLVLNNFPLEWAALQRTVASKILLLWLFCSLLCRFKERKLLVLTLFLRCKCAFYH